MTVKDVIDGFREGAEENVERDAYANELFQEAVRIGAGPPQWLPPAGGAASDA